MPSSCPPPSAPGPGPGDTQRAVDRSIAPRRIVTLVGDTDAEVKALAEAIRATREEAGDLVMWIPARGDGGETDVLTTLAGALQIERGSPADVAAELRARTVDLVILDGVERVAAANASALAEVLEATPDLAWLVTSRERLLLRAEVVVRIESPPSPEVEAAERAALDASWSALDAATRETMVRLSVFRGGFDVPAACAVAGLDEGELLDRLLVFVDRGWARSREVDELPGERRLELRPHVIDVAGLVEDASGSAAAWRSDAEARHGAHYVRLARELVEQLEASGAADARAHLALDADNLLAAGERALSRRPNDAVDAVAPLVGAIGYGAGLRDRARDLLVRATTRLTEGRHLAAACLGVGRICLHEGRLAEAAGALERSERVATRAGDERTAWRALLARATVLLRAGDREAAAELLAALDRAPGERASAADRSRAAACRGELALASGDPRAAIDACRAGQGDAHAHGDGALLAPLLTLAAMAELDLGLVDRAAHDARAAASCAEKAGARVEHAAARSTLGEILLARGELEAAERELRAAEAGQAASGEAFAFAETERRFAELLLLAGRLEPALERARAALDHLREIPACRTHRAAAGLLVAGYAATGRHAEAAELAAPLLGSDADATRLHLAHLDALRAREALRRGDEEVAARHRDAAREVLRSTGRDTATARTAALLLARALPDESAGIPSSDPNALRIAADASWIVLPDGARVDLARRKALKALLAALVQARLERPGEATSAGTLFEVGWPEDAGTASQRDARVYVAVTRLRKLGLGQLLLSRDDGFLLDPRTRWLVATPG